MKKNTQSHQKPLFSLLLGAVAVATLFFSTVGQTTAASPSPSPKPSASPASKTASAAAEINTSDVRKRVEEYVEKNKDKVQGAVDVKAGNLKAVVGEIESVTEEAISVSHKAGKTRIPLESELQLVNKDLTQIKVEDIAIGNWAIIIGALEDQPSSNFVAKRVIILTKNPAPPERTITFGSASSVSAKDITIIHRKTNEEKKYIIDKNTQFTDSEDATFTAKELQEDRSYIVIGTKNSAGNLVARVIRALVPVDTDSE